MSTRKLSVGLVALSLCACSAGVEGEWQSREKLSNSERNELELVEDGSGELTMYARLIADGPPQKLVYEAEWTLQDDGEYDLDMTCDEGCEAGSEFDMDCVYDADFEQLDCEAKAPFSSYGFFEFERVEE